MNYYQEDSEPAGVVELKLQSFDLKPRRPLKISWSQETELDLKQFTASVAEMTRIVSGELDQMLWQLKIDSVLKAADDRELAYRKKIALFLEQMEYRK